MKIGIIGGTGRVGSRILVEALSRGHEVTVFVRNAGKISHDYKDVNIIQKDLFHLKLSDFKMLDVVVDAFGAPVEQAENHVFATKHLIAVLEDRTLPRLIVVGGAGSLFTDEEGHLLVESKGLKESPYYPTAKAQAEELTLLKNAGATLNWTYLSPPAVFEPGEKTGSYQVGKDHLLFDADGNSHISMEDYAIAVLDEIELPQNLGSRFTVAAK
ncbi:NAD(P)-dependent oxidoreductase [Listeria sp. PSOL-1]|uniref:NAD(P)-dependent oxidoreductase n=1 Tax=Listeria sp. PSOL-1 TaxID=1844999 RepID=UPI0013D51D30|nr:NAD(P)-dependent oxidoreductase [Listeria sp. PSOL-1]